MVTLLQLISLVGWTVDFDFPIKASVSGIFPPMALSMFYALHAFSINFSGLLDPGEGLKKPFNL